MGKKEDNNAGKNPSQFASNNKEDPVSQLKITMERLRAGVEKMGIALNSSTSNELPSQPEQKSDNGTSNGNDYKKEMSAEEKKAQRAAKAAEKKMRAEAAIAKKKQEENGETSQNIQKKENGNAGKKTQNDNKQDQKAKVQNSGSKQADNCQNDQSKKVKSGENLKEDSPTSEHSHKPSIKSSKSSGRSDPKEVKFDLSANTAQSSAEENLAASLQNAVAASVPIEDGSSIAHIHPAFLCLAVSCEEGIISEVDQLCDAFLLAFEEYLNSWMAQRTRDNVNPATISHDLDLAIRPQLAHLTQDGRWPLPLALGNIVRQMKKEIAKIGKSDLHLGTRSISDLHCWLKECREINFCLAYKAIAEHLEPKLKSASSILTYDWSPVVNHVLLTSSSENQICCIVDHEMNGNGMKHLEPLIEKGMKCRYTDLKSIGYAIQTVNMVLLGCSAVLSNGNIAASKGSLQLALTAKANNVPVLVVAQSFKFVDKVQSYGRMSLLGRESIEVVPADLITAIVTDMRILPPSSAPAVLKAKALDME